jgi:hypothetical protein
LTADIDTIDISGRSQALTGADQRSGLQRLTAVRVGHDGNGIGST